MAIPSLTAATIEYHTTPQVLQRGEHYYQSGAVVDICQRGNTVQSTVEGSEVEPYRVTLQFDEGGLKHVDCTCAYDFEGWCKHIVATALMCLRRPQAVSQRPSLERLLDQLDQVQTQRLVQELVAAQPELIDPIDRFVTQVAHPTPQVAQKAPKRHTTVDPKPYRYQVQRLMRQALQYWEEGWEEDPIANDLPEVLNQVEAFIEQGDGNNALVILEAITQACAEDWDEIADYGGDGDYLVNLLDPVWAEAILSTEFRPGEEVDLQVNLEDWQDRLGGSFDLSSAALRQGWNDPALQAVLDGQPANLWEGNCPDYADPLAQIRLRILARQGRQDEYLNFAKVEGQIQEYLTMLTQLGRVSEVMAAQNQLTSVEQALEVAKALREQEAISEALAIAQYGLTLPESNHSNAHWARINQINQFETIGLQRYQLANWTSELAEGLSDRSAALTARIEAFKVQPSFRDYQKVQHLAENQWPTVKAELLNYLRQQRDSWRVQEAKVHVFLHEGLIDDAIAAVEPYGSKSLISRVMEAAIIHRPEWVIKKACRYAEEIMNRGKSEAYHEAADWLRKARVAYSQSGRQAKWQDYRNQLMTIHGRKYKLMGLLKQHDLE